MFVISLSYIRPLQEIDAFIQEHVEFLEKFYESGNFLLSGRKEPRTGGVILAKASSRTEMEDILRQDPFCREKLATYEVTEITPSKSLSEFRSLIEV